MVKQATRMNSVERLQMADCLRKEAAGVLGGALGKGVGMLAHMPMAGKIGLGAGAMGAGLYGLGHLLNPARQTGILGQAGNRLNNQAGDVNEIYKGFNH